MLAPVIARRVIGHAAETAVDVVAADVTVVVAAEAEGVADAGATDVAVAEAIAGDVTETLCHGFTGI